MRAMLEREVKLEPEDGFSLPELPGRPLEPRVFTSTYYDTPPRSLALAGITLRRRVENGLSLWQMKLPRAGDARAELEGAGGPAGPPAELRALLATHLRHGALEQVATLRTRRAGVRVAEGERALADVTVDSVEILEGLRSAGRFVELEIELVDGDAGDLDRLAHTLRKAGAQPASARSKLLRVLVVPGEGRPADGAPAAEQLRFLLGHQLLELEAHDPGVRLGEDPEDVHGMRVAARRARALIRATRPLLGEALASLGEELRWLGGVLGPVRDLDVLLEHLRLEVEGLDGDRSGGARLVAQLEEERERHRDALLAALDSERYLRLLETFATETAAIRTIAESGFAPVAAAQLKKLRAAAKELPAEPSDDELHAIRIRVKRARYAAELAAIEDGKKTERYLRALKKVQDVIGDHQDAVVAEERLRGLARAQTAVAAGRLIERERARKEEARAAYTDALSDAIERGRRAL